MHTLKSLYRLISRKRLKKIEVLNDEAGKRSSPALKFYRLLGDDAIQTDEQLSQAMFRKKPDSNYRSFKKRVRDLMLNSTFFLDMDKTGFPVRLRKLHDCSRNAHAVKMLIYTGHLKGAMELAESTLPDTLTYELWNEAVPMLGYLQRIAALQIDHKRSEKYAGLLEEVLAKQQAEYEAEKLRAIINLRTLQPKVKFAVIARESLSASRQVEALWKKHGTFHLKYTFMLLQRTTYFLADEYGKVAGILQQMANFYQDHLNFVSPEHWAELYNGQIYASLYLQDLRGAKNAAQRGIQITPEKGAMWFVFHRYYFLVLMYAENYKEAININHQILHHPDFKNQIETNKEEWLIYNGYGRFAESAFLNTAPDNKLRIHKLLNEIKIYWNNKEGLHIALLVLEILYYLINREFLKIMERMEALRQYKKRNLKIAETTRVRIFIDLLNVAEKNSFDKKATLSETDGLVQQLNAIPRGSQGNIENIEIIPFERLWPWVGEQLSGA